MDQFLLWIKEVSSSPFLIIGSFLIAIIGVILAIIFFIKSRRKKLPLYSKKSINIISDFISTLANLDIKYKEEPIQNLTLTKMVFWNGGNVTIENTDIASADPLTIQAKEGSKILRADIIQKSSDANLMKLSDIQNGNSLSLTFDFLDKGQGGIIEIVHTGKSSDDIDLKGTIKGSGSPVSKNVYSTYHLQHFVRTLPPPLSNIIGQSPKTIGKVTIIVLIFCVLIGISLILFAQSEKDKTIGWVLCAYGLIIIPTYIMFLKRKIPKSLELFEE